MIAHRHGGGGASHDPALLDDLIGDDQTHPVQSQGGAAAFQHRRDGVLALQHRLGDGLQQLGLRRGTPSHPGTTGGPVHHHRHPHGRDDVEQQRHQVLDLTHRHGEPRVDEEEVQGQTGRQSSRHRRPETADDGDDHREQYVGQHDDGEHLGAAGRCQPPREQRAGRHQGREADDASAHRHRSCRQVGQCEPGGSGMVDDVDVDVTGLADDDAADPRPGQHLG